MRKTVSAGKEADAMDRNIETVIELYDEEPIFNILAVSALKPRNVVFWAGN